MMSRFSAISALIFVYFSGVAAADSAPYNRFWRGWKAEVIDGHPQNYDGFAQALGQIFIPSTVQYGRGKGLTAYLPAIPVRPDQLLALRRQGVDLPDEMALVVYESEASYKALRQTPVGQAYAKLHTRFFSMDPDPLKTKSKSAVPELFAGPLVAIDHAYDLLQSNANWMVAPRAGAVVRFQLHLKKPEVSQDVYLRMLSQDSGRNMRFAQRIGLVSDILSVAPNYWIEYQIWRRGFHPQSTSLDIERGRLDLKVTPVLSGQMLKFGSVANVQF